MQKYSFSLKESIDRTVKIVYLLKITEIMIQLFENRMDLYINFLNNNLLVCILALDDL